MIEVSNSSIGISLLAGSLTTLSPCVFPLIPLVVGSAVQANRLAPLAMGLGMVLAFMTVGMLLGTLGVALGIDVSQGFWRVDACRVRCRNADPSV